MKKGSKKPDSRIRHLNIRLTQEEFDYIDQKAKNKKMNKSDYLRYLVKKDK